MENLFSADTPFITGDPEEGRVRHNRRWIVGVSFDRVLVEVIRVDKAMGY